MPKGKALGGSPTKYRQKSLFDHFSSTPTVSRSRPSKQTQAKQEPTSSESDSGPQVRVHPRKPVRSKRTPGQYSDDSDTRGIKFEIGPSSSGSIDADGIPSPSRQGPLSQRALLVQSDSDELSDIVVGTEKGKGKQKDVGDYDSDLEAVPAKRKRRLIKGERPTSEERDDILDGIDEDKIIGKRLRTSKKTTYIQNLERLKRKKRGLPESEDEEGSDELEDIIPGARLAFNDDEENQSSASEDDEADDFIVEDGDVATTLPVEFSMATYQDLAHHFKIVCQYFVHLSVTSEGARGRIADMLAEEDYFRVPLMMTRQKLGDLRDSLMSSVWKNSFKKALNIYPEFDLVSLDFTVPHCDACNLSNRISTLLGRLGGIPYDKKTFEAARSEDSDSSDESSRDSTGTNAPEFNLGRFCARRTDLYHSLTHWEYDLFWCLYREVATLSGENVGFVRAAKSNISPPDDISDADQVMNWLDELNVIHEEWQKIKRLMTDTTNFEADAKRGGDD